MNIYKKSLLALKSSKNPIDAILRLTELMDLFNNTESYVSVSISDRCSLINIATSKILPHLKKTKEKALAAKIIDTFHQELNSPIFEKLFNIVIQNEPTVDEFCISFKELQLYPSVYNDEINGIKSMVNLFLSKEFNQTDAIKIIAHSQNSDLKCSIWKKISDKKIDPETWSKLKKIEWYFDPSYELMILISEKLEQDKIERRKQLQVILNVAKHITFFPLGSEDFLYEKLDELVSTSSDIKDKILGLVVAYKFFKYESKSTSLFLKIAEDIKGEEIYIDLLEELKDVHFFSDFEETDLTLINQYKTSLKEIKASFDNSFEESLLDEVSDLLEDPFIDLYFQYCTAVTEENSIEDEITSTMENLTKIDPNKKN